MLLTFQNLATFTNLSSSFRLKFLVFLERRKLKFHYYVCKYMEIIYKTNKLYLYARLKDQEKWQNSGKKWWKIKTCNRINLSNETSLLPYIRHRPIPLAVDTPNPYFFPEWLSYLMLIIHGAFLYQPIYSNGKTRWCKLLKIGTEY